MEQAKTAEELAAEAAAEEKRKAEAREQAALAEARQKSSDAELIKVVGYGFVVRPPTGQEWDRFQEAMHSDSAPKRAKAGVTLFLDCCMWPARGEVKEILQKKPGIPMSAFNVLSDMAGAGAVVEKKS
jgi:hypothetical protein